MRNRHLSKYPEPLLGPGDEYEMWLTKHMKHTVYNMR